MIVPNRIEEIQAIRVALEEFCERQNVSSGELFQIQLSLEEVFTNVVSYAHDDDQEHEVEIIFSKEGQIITVEILDDGYPFNPLQDVPEPDVESSLEDRGVGGVGVKLAKQMMTELRYQRDNARNHLTMIKKI